MTIRLTQLRKTDLNLLVYFVVIMEERGISRAAKRLHLSQPSVSRAFKRLRELFDDELLAKTPKGYDPTPRGQSLLDEIAVMLPQIERLIVGKPFDPTRDRTSFRICATDNATQLYGPVLCRELARTKVCFIFEPWCDDRFLEIERNHVDLVLDANLGIAPETLRSEVLFQDEFTCVVAKNSPLPDALSLSQYLAQEHIGVNVLNGRQTLPELALRLVNHKRRCPITLPYFTVAIKLVESTPFIVTAPLRLAKALANPKTTRLLCPPKQMESFSYMMFWHPRLDNAPHHRWLRQTMRDVTRAIPSL